MANGNGQEKSTGYTPPIRTEKGKGLAPVESTAQKSALPVSKNAHTQDVSMSSPVEVQASNLLAVQVMMGDFREVKAQLPRSWQASSNGKIYWCIDFTGHKLQIVDGKLLVDETPAENLLQKLLAEVTK